MIIAIDFDGTIVKNAFPEIGEPLPGAIDTIRDLQAAGHHIIIWTCREGKHLADAYKWLSMQGVDVRDLGVNSNAADMIEEFGRDVRKVFANVYIDDRNLGGFPGWFTVRQALLAHHEPGQATYWPSYHGLPHHPPADLKGPEAPLGDTDGH